MFERLWFTEMPASAARREHGLRPAHHSSRQDSDSRGGRRRTLQPPVFEMCSRLRITCEPRCSTRWLSISTWWRADCSAPSSHRVIAFLERSWRLSNYDPHSTATDSSAAVLASQSQQHSSSLCRSSECSSWAAAWRRTSSSCPDCAACAHTTASRWWRLRRSSAATTAVMIAWTLELRTTALWAQTF